LAKDVEITAIASTATAVKARGRSVASISV
jgi:hypothetical protein